MPVPDESLALSDDYRVWVVENLIAGVEAKTLETRLVARGVPRALARREIEAIRSSPALPACVQLSRRLRRAELVLALERAHARQAPEPQAIERRKTPEAEAFFRLYWGAHQPVVLTDAMRGWPALKKWTPAWLRRRFGDEQVHVTKEREGDPDYDANYKAHERRMRLRDFVDEVLAAGVSNDLYMVSNNRTMAKQAFKALLDDVRPPQALFDRRRLDGGVSFWFGPAGTVTPLHHDTTNILLCQVLGRKRVELVAPNESALLLDPVHGFYSPVDLDKLGEAKHPALAGMLVKRTVLAPGDALFIPAGWWHRVTSLDVSISLSLLCFRRPNDFDWYRPGQLR